MNHKFYDPEFRLKVLHKAMGSFLLLRKWTDRGGLCGCIMVSIIEVDSLAVAMDFQLYGLRLFPEINKHKPREMHGGYWFHPRESEPRIKILNAAIQELTSIISTK